MADKWDLLDRGRGKQPSAVGKVLQDNSAVIRSVISEWTIVWVSRQGRDTASAHKVLRIIKDYLDRPQLAMLFFRSTIIAFSPPFWTTAFKLIILSTNPPRPIVGLGHSKEEENVPSGTAPGLLANTLPIGLRSFVAVTSVKCWLTSVPDPIAEQLNLTSPTFPGALPSNLHCGEMDVPMDYTQPFNAITNNITIGFAMARPAQTASGLILYHAGGPGENAAAVIWASALNLSDVSEGLEAGSWYVGVNVRGIQFSNPLNLTTSVFNNASDVPFPSTQAEFDQYTARHPETRHSDTVFNSDTLRNIRHNLSISQRARHIFQQVPRTYFRIAIAIFVVMGSQWAYSCLCFPTYTLKNKEFTGLKVSK
ncbi:hypothetical protein C8R45DRAFT_930531 [Mycena sanguinolenta]|nr:hypothetical protein C8R45DRAFT_930531 [Mycena sanguinolenta]